MGCEDGKGKRYSVLVVDDDAAALESIVAVLSFDLDVVACTSPARALILFGERPFHVVVADYHMPGMTGTELLRRACIMRPQVGCLLITGAAQHMLREDAAQHYLLLKPFDPTRLVAVVHQLARVTEMRRSVEDLATRIVAPYRLRMGMG